jgi:tetratricopeptide (TPR) repeat protein
MAGPRYHVFLSHNGADRPAVDALAHRLRREGIEPWLDVNQLVPGVPWMEAIEQALDQSDSCAVFIGPSGLSPWQTEEMRAAITKRVSGTEGKFRVIPVLLPGAERPERSRLPAYLIATTWVEFRDSLDDQEAFHRLVSGIRGIEPGFAPGEAPFDGACPYRGLQPFEEAHAPFFFGREALTEWLIDALRPSAGSRPENRFLAVIGPSGSGKSSLTLAGLVPALKRGGLGDGALGPVVICRPGHEPPESLAIKLAPATGREPSLATLRDLIDGLKQDQRSLHLITRQVLSDGPATRRLTVVVDQFEEVFTLCQDAVARQALIDNLLYASSIAGGQTVVVLTLRADFYGKCAAYPALAAALSDHQLLVGPMTEDELRRAIERPAQLAGCELEVGLTERLLQDVEHQPGALPLLQFALRELWERREGRRLTNAAYRAIGGLEGALENRANAILRDFDATERELCRRIFLRLTQPGEGTEDTKRRARLWELETSATASAVLAGVVQRLVDARLITAEGDGRHTEGGTIEVAHEALIRGWTELRQWIDADRAGLRIHHRLSEAAREWDAASRHSSYLYAGARLAVAREWAAAHGDELNALEADFLAASYEAERQQEANEIETARQSELAARRIAEEARKKLWASRLALASVVLAGALAAVVVWSAWRERSRLLSMRTEALGALAAARSHATEARNRKDLSDWDAALQAAERASSLVRSGIGDDVLLKEIQAEFEEIQGQRMRCKKDVEIRRRLEEITMRSVKSKSDGSSGAAHRPVTPSDYRPVFRDYGIDFDALPDPRAVAIVRDSEIRDILTSALEDYADNLADARLAERVRELVRQADPDERRNVIRDALVRKDRTALKQIAHAPDVDDLPPSRALQLAIALASVGERGEIVPLLQRAQRRHVGDFWINFSLAAFLSVQKPARYQEAVRYYTAAVALRPDDPGLRLVLGEALVQQGDHDGAFAICEEVIRLDPQRAGVYSLRAIVWYKKREYDKALADLDTAIQLDPKDARTYANRAIAWYSKKEFDRALGDLDTAIRLDPKDARIYASRATMWRDRREYDKALADLDTAIRLDPRNAEAHNHRGNVWDDKKEYEKAIADYGEAIRLDPMNAFAYRQRGYVWAEKKEYEKAIADYGEAIRLDPAYAVAHNDRGAAWYAKKDYDKAIADFDAAVRLDPNYALAYRGRGVTWREKSEYDKALADLDTAIRLDAKDAEAYNHRGNIWSDKREYDKAIADYSAAIRLDPKHAFAYRNRGVMWRAKKAYDRAIADYNEAIRVNPSDAAAYNCRGNVRTDRQEYDKAIADYNEAIHLDPNDALTYRNRGSTWSDKREYDKAIADFNEVIRRDPTDATAHYNRGAAWGAKRDYDKAIADYDVVIRLVPSFPVAYFDRGLARYHRRKYDKAIADFDEAVRLDPKSHRAQNELAWLLATCPVERFRDGKKALVVATRACELADFKSFKSLDTLAAAYAENGLFDKAVETQTKAIEKLPASEARDLRSQLQRRLELYTERKPYHDEPN